jgi:hypothetical protein
MLCQKRQLEDRWVFWPIKGMYPQIEGVAMREEDGERQELAHLAERPVRPAD